MPKEVKGESGRIRKGKHTGKGVSVQKGHWLRILIEGSGGHLK